MVIDAQRLLLDFLFERVELLVEVLGLVGVLVLLSLQLLLLLLQLFVARQDVVELGEFVRVGLLDSLKEVFINLHLGLFGFDAARLRLVGLEAHFGLLNLRLEHVNPLLMVNEMRWNMKENGTYLVFQFLELNVLLASILLQL